MIRINLLSEGRRPVVARKAKPSLSLGGQDPNNLLLFAGILLGVLLAGGWWWILHSELSFLQTEVRSARAEYARLEPIIRQVEEYERKQADLERKVAVIKDLKEQQRGPVNVMDKISRTLPDLVWLEQMSIQGSQVSLRGRAFNTNAVAAFIENLDAVEEFQEPDARSVRKGVISETDVYSFQITFAFVLQVPKAEEAVEGDGEEVATGP